MKSLPALKSGTSLEVQVQNFVALHNAGLSKSEALARVRQHAKRQAQAGTPKPEPAPPPKKPTPSIH